MVGQNVDSNVFENFDMYHKNYPDKGHYYNSFMFAQLFYETLSHIYKDWYDYFNTLGNSNLYAWGMANLLEKVPY